MLVQVGKRLDWHGLNRWLVVHLLPRCCETSLTSVGASVALARNGSREAIVSDLIAQNESMLSQNLRFEVNFVHGASCDPH